ncbi:hypothetical protein H6P81_014280 [Aristolochia fimbriata]|uniref:Uncharacterized protein n=1 Tax=Aristolochia fimbriata TaxID=158543 RepID=A0AAV7EKQ2_ARIFI|nr:hypothetical protein H6P81_014280 [Aristolochia fimbriata]
MRQQDTMELFVEAESKINPGQSKRAPLSPPNLVPVIEHSPLKRRRELHPIMHSFAFLVNILDYRAGAKVEKPSEMFEGGTLSALHASSSIPSYAHGLS